MHKRPSGRERFFVALATFVVLTAFCGVSVAAETKDERQKRRLHSQLAGAWNAFFAGKYPKAAKLAAPLLKLDNRRYKWIAVEAGHLQARCYWAHGSKASRTKARRIWAKLKNSSTLNSLLARLKIAGALELEASGDPEKIAEAIAILDGILKDRQPNTATPEAALVASRLYVKAGRFDEAEHTLKVIKPWIERDLLSEYPKELVKPFISAAGKALGRLEYQRDAGRQEFEKAQSLRRRKEFTKALSLYRKIIKKYPFSNYASPGKLHIGHCLLGMNRVKQAAAHWKKFIIAAPTGPWRGRAYVGLVDIYLEHLQDLAEAGKYAELARNSLSVALGDKKPDGSWKGAAFDIHLRAGIVALAQGRGETAIEAFEDAIESGKSRKISKQTLLGLDCLISAAKSGKPITPEDVLTGGNKVNERAALALLIGTIYNTACNFTHGEVLFDRVLRNKIPSRSPQQLSYANFGKAVSIHGLKKLTQAKAFYITSLKSFPKGTWHDETLYRIASIIQHQALDEYEKKPSEKTKKKPDHRRQYIKASSAAIPYLRSLTKRYPTSPRIPSALYELAMLLIDQRQFSSAEPILAKLVTNYPHSKHSGKGYLHLIDINLDEFFELSSAEKYADLAVKWVEAHKVDPEKQASSQPAKKPKPKPGDKWSTHRPADPFLLLRYRIYVRAGLVAHLDNKPKKALAMFRAGDKYCGRSSLAATGIQRLAEIVKGGRKPLTPDSLAKLYKNERQRTVVLLADLYLLCCQPEKSGRLYEKIFSRHDLLGKPQDSLKAYVLWRLGQSLEFQDQDRHDEAIICLNRLYAKKYADTPWAAEGIFRIGTWSYNRTQNPEMGLKHWKYVFTKYPKHPEAERSLFYYGLYAAKAGKYKLSVRACRLYLKRYPDSRWTNRVRKELLPETLKKMKEK